MKTAIEMTKELEQTLMNNLSSLIHDILAIKFQKKISEITKIEMTDIIQYHINDTIWIDQIKNNIKDWILEYQMDMAEQSKQLNIRMDFLEQRFMDFYRKVEQEFVKK